MDKDVRTLRYGKRSDQQGGYYYFARLYGHTAYGTTQQESIDKLKQMLSFRVDLELTHTPPIIEPNTAIQVSEEKNE